MPVTATVSRKDYSGFTIPESIRATMWALEDAISLSHDRAERQATISHHMQLLLDSTEHGHDSDFPLADWLKNHQAHLPQNMLVDFLHARLIANGHNSSFSHCYGAAIKSEAVLNKPHHFTITEESYKAFNLATLLKLHQLFSNTTRSSALDADDVELINDEIRVHALCLQRYLETAARIDPKRDEDNAFLELATNFFAKENPVNGLSTEAKNTFFGNFSFAHLHTQTKDFFLHELAKRHPAYALQLFGNHTLAAWEWQPEHFDSLFTALNSYKPEHANNGFSTAEIILQFSALSAAKNARRLPAETATLIAKKLAALTGLKAESAELDIPRSSASANNDCGTPQCEAPDFSDLALRRTVERGVEVPCYDLKNDLDREIYNAILSNDANAFAAISAKASAPDIYQSLHKLHPALKENLFARSAPMFDKRYSYSNFTSFVVSTIRNNSFDGLDFLDALKLARGYFVMPCTNYADGDQKFLGTGSKAYPDALPHSRDIAIALGERMLANPHGISGMLTSANLKRYPRDSKEIHPVISYAVYYVATRNPELALAVTQLILDKQVEFTDNSSRRPNAGKVYPHNISQLAAAATAAKSFDISLEHATRACTTGMYRT